MPGDCLMSGVSAVLTAGGIIVVLLPARPAHFRSTAHATKQSSGLGRGNPHLTRVKIRLSGAVDGRFLHAHAAGG
jgi:hypothetical protein